MPLSLQHLGEAVSSNLLLADQKHFGDQPGDAWQLSALSWAARLRGSQKPTCGCTPSSRPRARSGEVMHDDLRPADQSPLEMARRRLAKHSTLPSAVGWSQRPTAGRTPSSHSEAPSSEAMSGDLLPANSKHNGDRYGGAWRSSPR